jgi:restriction system protein
METNHKAEFLEWMGPLLDALRALDGSAKPREIAEWIAKKLELPDEITQKRYKKSGTLRFANQIAWARQYLVWEELLESSKHGVWSLTTKGWTTQINSEAAHSIYLKWSKRFAQKKENKLKDAEEIVLPFQESQEIEIAPINAQPTLLEILQNLSPRGFEHLCGRLLKEYEFENVEITQQSHDGGIDGFATLKLNPFVSLSVYFQCKRYIGTVPTEKVQAFIGVMETNRRQVEKGIIITTGSFAKGAREIAKTNIKIELIDGDQLIEMFEKAELGLIPKTIYEPDLLFFEQYRTM